MSERQSRIEAFRQSNRLSCGGGGALRKINGHKNLLQR
jgi:hypothetical protein